MKQLTTHATPNGETAADYQAIERLWDLHRADHDGGLGYDLGDLEMAISYGQEIEIKTPEMTLEQAIATAAVLRLADFNAHATQRIHVDPSLGRVVVYSADHDFD